MYLGPASDASKLQNYYKEGIFTKSLCTLSRLNANFIAPTEEQDLYKHITKLNSMAGLNLALSSLPYQTRSRIPNQTHFYLSKLKISFISLFCFLLIGLTPSFPHPFTSVIAWDRRRFFEVLKLIRRSNTVATWKILNGQCNCLKLVVLGILVHASSRPEACKCRAPKFVKYSSLVKIQDSQLPMGSLTLPPLG